MIAKALMNLDRVVYTLDPGFRSQCRNRETRRMRFLQRNVLRSLSPSSLLAGAVDVKEFAEKLPTAC